MKRFIVVTTINPMNDVLRAYANAEGWTLVVVGDRKGPKGIDDPRVVFLDVDGQQNLGFTLAKHLPENHYARKSLGYLYAISEGADLVAESDDDNAPLAGWGVDTRFSLTKAETVSGVRFHNVYQDFTKDRIWPRGYPLAELLKPSAPHRRRADAEVGVWQGLAKGEPDVDAIYRLTSGRVVRFRDRRPVVLDAGVYCPFNSQNTFWRKEAFPLLYLPATVSFRFTDILRGYVGQRLLWDVGLRVAFGKASVVQGRNRHSLMADFESEIPMYAGVESVVETLSFAIEGGSLSGKLVAAYDALRRRGIVADAELEMLDCWVRDIGRLIPRAG